MTGSCSFGSSLQPNKESIIREAVRAFCKVNDVIDTRLFQHKFQDKIRHLQWPEKGSVWT